MIRYVDHIQYHLCGLATPRTILSYLILLHILWQSLQDFFPHPISHTYFVTLISINLNDPLRLKHFHRSLWDLQCLLDQLLSMLSELFFQVCAKLALSQKVFELKQVLDPLVFLSSNNPFLFWIDSSSLYHQSLAWSCLLTGIGKYIWKFLDHSQCINYRPDFTHFCEHQYKEFQAQTLSLCINYIWVEEILFWFLSH